MALRMLTVCLFAFFFFPSLVFAQSQVPVEKDCKAQWKKKYKPTFRKKPLLEVVKFIAKQTCYNFIVGNKVRRKKISIIVERPVSLYQLYRAFLATLEVNQIAIIRVGRFRKLVSSKFAGKTSIRTYVSGKKFRHPRRDEIVTYLLRVKYIDVNKLYGILRRLANSSTGQIISLRNQNMLILVQYAPNLYRLLKIAKALDIADAETKDKMFITQVEYGQATEFVNVFKRIFQVSKRRNTRNRRYNNQVREEHRFSKVIADQRTNRLIFVGSQRAFINAEILLKKIDVPLDGNEKIHVHYLKYAKAEEVSQTLSQLNQGRGRRRRRRKTKKARLATSTDLFGGEMRITADKATNSLVIVANQRDYESILKVIKKLDIRRKQVFVEAVILEVSLTKSRDMGMAFHGGVPTSNDSTNPELAVFGFLPKGLGGLNSILVDPSTLQGMALGLTGPALQGSSSLIPGASTEIPAFGVILRALKTSEDVDIISTPHILTATNQTASIQVGQNVPFVAGLSSSTFGVTQNINRQDVALKMEIVPQINAGDRIKLKVSVELNEIASEHPVRGPTTTKRQVQTTIRVKDKQTIVLGGLMREKADFSEQKIPFLGDIPVLGMLFRNRVKKKEKRNLLIFLTPSIVSKPEDFQKIFIKKLKERKAFLKHFQNRKPRRFLPKKKKKK